MKYQGIVGARRVGLISIHLQHPPDELKTIPFLHPTRLAPNEKNNEKSKLAQPRTHPFEATNMRPSGVRTFGVCRGVPGSKGFFVSSQKIGQTVPKPDRFWKPVGFFPELLSMSVFSVWPFFAVPQKWRHASCQPKGSSW